MIVTFSLSHDSPKIGLWTDEDVKELMGKPYVYHLFNADVSPRGTVIDSVISEDRLTLKLMVEYDDDPGTTKLLAAVGLAVSLPE